MKMKFLVAALVLLITTPAFADNRDRYRPDYASPQRGQCAVQFFHAQEGSKRWGRAKQHLNATAPWSPERMRLRYSAEGRAMVRAAELHCAARGM
jgi:hypothetical protein